MVRLGLAFLAARDAPIVIFDAYGGEPSFRYMNVPASARVVAPEDASACAAMSRLPSAGETDLDLRANMGTYSAHASRCLVLRVS